MSQGATRFASKTATQKQLFTHYKPSVNNSVSFCCYHCYLNQYTVTAALFFTHSIRLTGQLLTMAGCRRDYHDHPSHHHHHELGQSYVTATRFLIPLDSSYTKCVRQPSCYHQTSLNVTTMVSNTLTILLSHSRPLSSPTQPHFHLIWPKSNRDILFNQASLIYSKPLLLSLL